MKKCGFHADYILEALVNALDAYTVNDMFNFIFRKHNFAKYNPESKENIRRSGQIRQTEFDVISGYDLIDKTKLRKF